MGNTGLSEGSDFPFRGPPAFATRGVMLDISRNKVPTMDTLLALVDQLTAWKINHLQLYTEHTFAYAGHEEVWRDASPMTAEEIRQLDSHCRKRHIELAANQNSFGHLHRWLKLPAYRHLAESPDGYTTPWGETRTGPFSLNPLHPGSLELLDDLYDQLLPNFSSPPFNVGCDETFDLGQGASRAACEAEGKGRIYLRFLQQIKRRVEQRGKTMLFWGDIILNHPELIPELERNAIALVWGYEAGHPFDEQCRRFAAAGIPYWVCPGTSTWNSITGRLDNALANIDAAAKAGLAHGASGFMITEWGDNGHWQTMPFSLLALAAGAFAAWHGHAPDRADLADLFPGAETAIQLGNLYQEAGFPLHNTSPIFPLIRFQEPDKILAQWNGDCLAAASKKLENILSEPLAATGVIGEEIQLGGKMLGYALRRGSWMKAGRPDRMIAPMGSELEGIVRDLERLWLIRNRPGGLEESLAPLRARLMNQGDLTATGSGVSGL
jgi:hypothetical protein